MKRLLFLPLLALPLLFLSCDGQVPSEPSADASTPTFAKATTPVPLAVLCPTCTDIDGGDFYTGGGTRTFEYDVCPATKGIVQGYRCYVGGNFGTASDCDSGAGDWVAMRPFNSFKYLITPSSCTGNIWSLGLIGVDSGMGHMLKYKPRGSGYYPGTYSFTVFSTSGP